MFLLLRIFAEPFDNILALVKRLTVNEETGDLLLASILHKSVEVLFALVDVADFNICPSLLVNLPAHQMAVFSVYFFCLFFLFIFILYFFS